MKANLAGGEFLVVCYNKATFDSTFSGVYTCDVEDADVAYTAFGDDNYVLVTNHVAGESQGGPGVAGDSLTIFDVYGVVGEDGTGNWNARPARAKPARTCSC